MGNADADEYFTIEKILDKRKHKGVIQYLIKWEGYSTSDNTWETRKHMISDGMKKDIQEFEKKLKAKKGAGKKTPIKSKKGTPKKTPTKRSRSKTPLRKSSSSKQSSPQSESPKLKKRTPKTKTKKSVKTPKESRGRVPSFHDISEGINVRAILLFTFLGFCIVSNVLCAFLVHGGLERTLKTHGAQGPWWWPANILDSPSETGWEDTTNGVHETNVAKMYRDGTLKGAQSVLRWIRLSTMVVPSLISLFAVLKVKGEKEKYARWIAIGMVWYIAAEILQHININPLRSDETSNFIVMLMSYTVGNFAFALAFNSATHKGELVPFEATLMLITIVPLMLLFMSTRLGDFRLDAILCTFFGVIGGMCWRAAARIGYGHPISLKQESLPQWLGLTGAAALSTAHLFILADKNSPYSTIQTTLKPAFSQLALMSLYWCGLVTLVASAVLRN